METPPEDTEFLAENDALRSNIHTLVVSFPPGEQRMAAVAQLPELASGITVESILRVEGPGTARYNEFLQDLFGKAVSLAGGAERAQQFLEYPGLTSDEQLGEVHPVPESWQDAELKANELFPQMGTAIRILGSRCIIEDLAAGRAFAEDLLYAYQNRTQIEQEKVVVARLHDRFRDSPAMPTGYDHAKMSMRIPDASFQGLWRGTTVRGAVTVASLAASWAERVEGIHLPEAELPYRRGVNVVDPANVERLKVFFEDERFKPYIRALLDLYEAAGSALVSNEGGELRRRHLRGLNSKHPSKTGDNAPIDDEINEFIRNAIEKRAATMLEAGGSPPLLHEFAMSFVASLVDQKDPRTAFS
jgi:hypothetical protein